MNCSNYQSLTPLEKAQFIGKIVHAVQNDNICFIAGNMIIKSAEESGYFEGVKILDNGEDKISTDSVGSNVV